MMKTETLARSVSVLIVLPTLMMSQTARVHEPVPLKQWSAPLRWQPPSFRQSVDGTEYQPLAAERSAPEAGMTSGPLSFVGMTPCRIMDTRAGSGQTGAFGPPTLSGGSIRTVPIPTHPSCAVPATALAYSLNVTVVPPTGVPLYFLTIWPTGQAQPNASTLNDVPGMILANAAVVPAGTSGSVNIFVLNTTDVVVDINGYYVAETPAPNQVWSANILFPPSITSVLSALPSGGSTGISGGGFWETGLPLPRNCTASNFSVTVRGAAGTSTAQAVLTATGPAQFDLGTVAPTTLSCGLTAANGSMISCTSLATQALTAPGFLNLLFYSFSQSTDFNNARAFVSFVCN